jgi:hypothetical protein
MSLVDRYREFATACVRVAQQATNADDKASLLQMAEAWLWLAERASKSDDKGEQ